MNPVSRLLPAYTEVDEDQARQLANPGTGVYAVEVKPPRSEKVPSTVRGFVQGILELQTSLLGIKNRSPVATYEIRRSRPDRLQFQFCVPTKRLERKVRSHLSNQVPGIGFGDGTTALPVAPDDSIGGGILSLGREDRFPLETEFDSPPVNGLVASLHRHAMRDTKFTVQILFQPVSGRTLGEWRRKHLGYKTVNYLRKEKEQIWGSRSPTPRERHQADLVEQKLGQRRYWASIRFAVIGAGKHTPSRVKELAGAFNVFENPETGQYLNTTTIRGLRQRRFLEFYQAVGNRKFGGYSHKFQVSVPELAGLVSITDRSQDNIRYSQL